MNREELKAAVKEVYEQGYHKGFADACDATALASTEAITSIVKKLKERVKDIEIEIVDEHEEEE